MKGSEKGTQMTGHDGKIAMIQPLFLHLKPRRLYEHFKPNKGAKKLKGHRKKLAKTRQAIHMLYAGLLVACFECVPLGVLQGDNCPRQSSPGFLCVHVCAHAACARLHNSEYVPVRATFWVLGQSFTHGTST